jgi:hypothetical protein
MRQRPASHYPPGPSIWWTALNPDGSHSQDLTGVTISRPTSVTYRNTLPVHMRGFYVAAHVTPDGAGTKNMYFSLTDSYSGGPEFGFVYNSENRYCPMFFYWSTNSNCGGNAESDVHSHCTDAPCKAAFVPSLGEYQCSNSVNDVFENVYSDSKGHKHQVSEHSHSISLPEAFGRDLVYVAYLYRLPWGETWFHVEVDTPEGGVYRQLRFDLDPNAMGFGDWYPMQDLYESRLPGYLTITAQPGVPQPSGMALKVHKVAYLAVQ